MKIFIMLSALLSLNGVIYAQDTLESRHLITLSLFSPVLSHAPRYNAGYMYRFANRWRAGIEAGYGNDATAISMTQGSATPLFLTNTGFGSYARKYFTPWATKQG